MSQRSEVNELSASEWIDRTKTIMETNYPLDKTWGLRKICRYTKSPYILRDVIQFFTTGGETVLDPMANVGSTLIAASMCGRASIGIESNIEYVNTFKEIQSKYGVYHGQIVEIENHDIHNKLLQNSKMIHESPRYLESIKTGQVDFIVMSPEFGPEKIDEDSIRLFLRQFRKICDECFRILEDGRYFAFFMGDRYVTPEYVSLTQETAQVARGSGFRFKGKRILFDRAKPASTKAYNVGVRFVPNICHEELIIMMKESE